MSNSVQKPVLDNRYTTSEHVVAFVGAVGVELKKAEDAFESRVKATGYEVVRINITKDILPLIQPIAQEVDERGEYKRISTLMTLGNKARKASQNDSILALGVANHIAKRRAQGKNTGKVAYFIHSLKRPEEVRLLREIYPRGFYLVGVHASRDRRKDYLTQSKLMSSEQAEELMDRDMNEKVDHGQQIIDTFHLSDFFVRIEGNDDRLKKSIWRIVDLMYGCHLITPSFGEHAMFMAFASSLRSGDLSRQVGAVIARDGEILSTGANDSPKAGGGLYWPCFCEASQSIEDEANGRDSTRGHDSNKLEQREIIDSIMSGLLGKSRKSERSIRQILENSAISDLTEFGRVVHAEMEALLSCARQGISTKGATMYCTTFPCHNCAKHIIAAGIERVVFVEPYLKSKAIKLHDDSVQIVYSEPVEKLDKQIRVVRFEPFVGVGPRRFFELFSMALGVGRPLKRKDKKGGVLKWQPEGSVLRIQMLPRSYLELETEAANEFERIPGGTGISQKARSANAREPKSNVSRAASNKRSAK